MEYHKLYPKSALNVFDGATHVQQGCIKYGDALAAIAYAHGIEYHRIIHKWPQVTNDERWVGDTVSNQQQFISENTTRTPEHILEIGSGRGEVTGFLCNMGYKVTSVEPSMDAVELHTDTHQLLYNRTFEYTLINESLHTAGLDYSKFDTIIMVESLEHILAEHFDPEWEKIKNTFSGRFIVVNWLAYHPIAVGQYASNEIHCRLVDDELYDQFAKTGTTVYRDRSHIVIDM